jgi:uncharacterized membrane protein (UPF0182 family)
LLWRTPRARSLLLLAGLGVAAASLTLAAHLYTDFLWYRELGHERVLWATLKWKVLGRGVPGLGTACFLLANFAVVERIVGRHRPLRPHRRLVYPLVAVAAGAISSLWAGEGAWRLLALWAGRSDFGVEDPLFHRDVGYFVFSLPLYEQAARWVLATLAVTAVATVAAYVAAGRLWTARAHLLSLAALALAAICWRYRLQELALALPHRGSPVPGASYTDDHVRLPLLRALAVLSLAGGGVCVYAARRRIPVVALGAVAALGAIAVAAQAGLPALVQRFDVEPQELARQTPYLADAIAATRRAFGLDRVAVVPLRASARLSRRDVARNRRTLENLPLWDPNVLLPAMNELQAIGRYYSFPSSTVDRYRIDGAERVLAVGARHLDRSGLRPDARSWANDRFAYTHGYGVVAATSGRTDAGGRPHFPQRAFGPRTDPLRVSQPRIYFGETSGDDPPYIVVNSSRAEVDQPIPGSQAPEYHYDGPGGIALSSALRRVAFAARFGDLRLLLTETVDDDASRIVLHRDVHERVRALAPFLEWDRHAQTAVIGGRVVFLFHGYTTSTSYPYAARVRMGSTRASYVRAAAEAAVDAFTGQVRLYATDPGEPILRAWEAAYPGLFLPASEMPSGMREHLRYPRGLFAAQARAYTAYHAGDPTAFWNGSDAWQRPLQLAGPVEGAGGIRFPDPAAHLEADDRAVRGHWRVRPRYVMARLPGDARERFMMVMPYTPRGRENLTGYLAGSIGEDGRPRLTLLSLPRDRLTIGPSQATRRILADPGVNHRLELLNRESRDLGRSAVNRTILGDARLVPVGDSLVHVQPVYLVAAGSGVPRLQLITTYADGRVGYGRDLEAALRRAVGGAR